MSEVTCELLKSYPFCCSPLALAMNCEPEQAGFLCLGSLLEFYLALTDRCFLGYAGVLEY